MLRSTHKRGLGTLRRTPHRSPTNRQAGFHSALARVDAARLLTRRQHQNFVAGLRRTVTWPPLVSASPQKPSFQLFFDSFSAAYV